MARKLATKQTRKKENPGVEITRSILEYTLTLFILVLCIFVPLYMKNGYYKIGDAKFDAYAHIMVFGLPMVLLLLFLYKIFDWKEYGFLARVKEVPNKLMIIDYFFLIFELIAVLSYFLSGNMGQAFWGYDGWYMGLFFQLTICVLYFLVSRHGNVYQVPVSVLCVVAGLTYIFGILHRLLIDVLGTYEGISNYYKTQFLSTLGQASWYSSFVCTVLPLGVCTYFIAKKRYLRVCSGIFSLIGFMTLVTQNSDSAYIAVTLLFLMLLFFATESSDAAMRFLEILGLFFLAPKLMQLLLFVHPNETLDLDTISQKLIFHWIAYVLLGIVVLLWMVLFWVRKRNYYPQKALRIFGYLIYALFLFGMVFAVILLRLSTKESLSGFLLMITEKVPYLKWDFYWGNGRGFTWTVTAKMISEFSLKHKLIGVGPDCFATYGYANYADFIRSMWEDNILTNAHNEWMNMTVNYGFLGAVAYLGIFVSAFVTFVKNAKKEPVLLLFAGCIATYVGHNIFCYQQVLCTPFVILAIGYGMLVVRKNRTIKN